MVLRRTGPTGALLLDACPARGVQSKMLPVPAGTLGKWLDLPPTTFSCRAIGTTIWAGVVTRRQGGPTVFLHSKYRRAQPCRTPPQSVSLNPAPDCKTRYCRPLVGGVGMGREQDRLSEGLAARMVASGFTNV